MNKKIMTTLLLVVGISSISNFVFARTVGSYDILTPRLGGNGYSSAITKSVTGRKGVDNNSWNGAGKTLYSTIVKSSGLSNVTNEYTSTSGSRITIPYKTSNGKSLGVKDTKYRLMKETSLFDRANTASVGSWSPDEK